MKKVLLGLSALFLPMFLILILIMNTMTSFDTAISRNSAYNDEEEPLQIGLEGEISGDTLKQVSLLPQARASDSWVQIGGGINGDKITSNKNIWWLKGSGCLVSVGGGGDADGANSVTTGSGAQGAVDWAIGIAEDDSFNYGAPLSRARHAGCYFCGTNIKGPKHAKKGSKWEKTYVCNTFVFAAYAHGAGDKKLEKACKHKAAPAENASAWTKYGCFKEVGSLQSCLKSLQPGDVIISPSGPAHVCMYAGNGQIVEATSGGDASNCWKPSSIRLLGKKASKHKLKKYANKGNVDVVRYTGNGKGGTVLSIAGSGAQGAVSWGKSIADNNKYTYALTNTCHQCDNGGSKTYCCASFVRACYAHGAGDKDMLSLCKTHSGAVVSKLHNSMMTSKNFKSLGAIKQKNMQPGDVIFWGNKHVELYYGNGKRLGAHNSGLSPAKQISVLGMYGGYTDVMRYVGSGSGIGFSTNTKYNKPTVLKTINKNDVTKVASNSTPGTYPTAQSMAYMGNGKIAMCMSDVKKGNKTGTYGYIQIFENGKKGKKGPKIKIIHGNGLTYDKTNECLYSVSGFQDNTCRVIDAKSLKITDHKNMKHAAGSIALDTTTGKFAFGSGGNIYIANKLTGKHKKAIDKMGKIYYAQDHGAYNGVVYSCVSNKSDFNYINMYSESTGAYLGTYKLGFKGEMESVDVDETGHLLILVHTYGGHTNYVYKTKDAIALGSDASMMGTQGVITGLTIHQDIKIAIKYNSEKEKKKKKVQESLLLFDKVFAEGFTPSQEQIQTANRIAAALANRGYTREAIAGVLGNLHRESGLSTGSIEHGGGGGHGLAQWTGGRWDRLNSFAKSKGKDWTDLDAQIEYLCYELESYKDMEKQMRNMASVEEATKLFMNEFERPGVPALDDRIKYAKGYYAAVSAAGSIGGFDGEIDADVVVSIDKELKKCIVNGKINSRRVEMAGDIEMSDDKIHFVAQGLGSPSTTMGEFVSGQLSGMRTSYPESNNKWFFDTSHNRFPRNSKGGNCTWYAYGRFCEIAGQWVEMSKMGNAVTFYDSFPTCEKGQTPKVGAIVCWGYHGSQSGHPGHVAVVEEIKPNGDIVCSNSGWSGSKFWMSTHKKSEGYKMHYNNAVLRGFIYNPATR